MPLNSPLFSPEDSPKLGRVCCATEKPFEPGDRVYSALFEENGELKRRDYCADAWKANPRPQGALAWWRSRVATGTEKRAKIAPNDALTDLFESLADRPDQAALRYALALLLTRRRVFRFEREESESGDDASSALVVYSPRRETAYVVPVVSMDADQIADVQRRLAELLREPTAETSVSAVSTVSTVSTNSTNPIVPTDSTNSTDSTDSTAESR